MQSCLSDILIFWGEENISRSMESINVYFGWTERQAEKGALGIAQ